MSSRLKHLLRLQYGSALSADVREDGEFNVYGSNGIVGSHISRNTKEPAIIVGRKGSFGKVTWADAGGFCIDTAYFTDEQNCNGDLRYAYYALLHLKLDDQSKDSAVPGLDRNDAHNRKISVPDLPTQRAIADFLDRETARIDMLIEKKQRLVELLGEKYESELVRLMTRGPNEDSVDFVPSVYNWAPDVPKRWRQTPLRQLLRLKSGSVGDASGDFVLLSLTKQGVIRRDIESGKGKFPSDFSTYQAVEPNQLVLCLFDIDETPRTVGLSKDFGMITGAYTVADINSDRVNPEYIYYHLLYLDNGKRLKPFYTGLRKVIRPQTFLGIRIPLPSICEQIEIVKALQHWEQRANSIGEKTAESICRLKEYRSALITSAVTGQIDVAKWTNAGTTDRQLDAIEEEFGA